jgi:hypothetical protein
LAIPPAFWARRWWEFERKKSPLTACARHGICYFANDLQLVNPINERLRLRLHAATAILSLAVWLFMTVAEAYTPLHAWLHGGTIPDDDDCAVVAISHGKVDTVVVAAPAVAPVVWIEITPQIDFSIFHAGTALLPDGRAPPVLPAVS